MHTAKCSSLEVEDKQKVDKHKKKLSYHNNEPDSVKATFGISFKNSLLTLHTQQERFLDR